MNNTNSIPHSLKKLKEGNERFINGLRSIHSMASQTNMQRLAEDGQKPFAIVLTCSDSRSPVELIFDQGIGDLFVVRVAGNVVAPSLIASMEFAAANFGSHILVVLGHTQCGAVQATLTHHLHPEISLPSPHLEELVGRIRPAVESEKGSLTSPEALYNCTVNNIHRSAKLIVQQSEILRSLVAQKKLEVHSALLDISTGKVTFLNESES